MSRPVLAAHVIGQTPRVDLTAELAVAFPDVRVEVLGALDGLAAGELPPCGPDDDPLETRLGDGTRVVVGARFLSPLLQEAIERVDARVDAHLLLCAGAFDELTVPAPAAGDPTPLVRPFEAAATALAQLGHRRLDVVVPFAEQVGPATRKWGRKGFACRVHVLDEAAADRPLAERLPATLPSPDAEAVVFDYVGLPSAAVDEVAARWAVPVFDLGRIALSALAEILDPRASEAT